MRRVVSGHFELPTSAKTAIEFFTPEGERDWVPGWDPVYPTGEPSEASGTVFTTSAHGVDTIWLVYEIDRDASRAVYARVTPGHHAGTVQVECADLQEEGCQIRVVYDMSLLPGGDQSGLDPYEDRQFEAMMNHWASEVTRVLQYKDSL